MNTTRAALLLLLALTGCQSPRATVALHGSPTLPDQPGYQGQRVLLEYILSKPFPPAVYLPGEYPPTPTWRPYDQLLAFLRTGPGGSAVTEQHLRTIEPTLMALGAYAAANPTMTLAQLWASPQGQAAALSVFNVFAPLGLWSPAVAAWLQSNRATIRPLLETLYKVLLSGPPGSPPRGPPVIVYDPAQSLGALADMANRRDWLALAEYGPDLVYELTGLRPEVLVYGKRSGEYGIAIRLEDEDGTVHSVNEAGYSTGNQGPDDLTLTYYQVEVSRSHVETLDIEASDLARWAKLESGGDPSLLDRARTLPNTSLSLDLNWQGGSHLRISTGATRFASLSGVFVEQRLGSPTGYYQARLAVGAIWEEELLGYADLEVRLRTPCAKVSGSGGTAEAWGQVTLSITGLANRYWVQPDARLVPELLVELELKSTVRVNLAAGVTFAVVPHGRIHLDDPIRSLDLRPVRGHASLLIKADAGPIVLEWGAVIEAADPWLRSRIWSGVRFGTIVALAVVEIGEGDPFFGGTLGAWKITGTALFGRRRVRAHLGFEHTF